MIWLVLFISYIFFILVGLIILVTSSHINWYTVLFDIVLAGRL